jgi:hypothetical protein
LETATHVSQSWKMGKLTGTPSTFLGKNNGFQPIEI